MLELLGPSSFYGIGVVNGRLVENREKLRSDRGGGAPAGSVSASRRMAS